MYRLELLTRDRFTSTHNYGKFKISVYSLPRLVIKTTATKSIYRNESFEIKSWDGKQLKVNNGTWIAREKKK